MPRVGDIRVVAYEPLLSPAALLDELPLGDIILRGGRSGPNYQAEYVAKALDPAE